MPFTIERKKQSRMSFLDVQIIREDEKSLTSNEYTVKDSFAFAKEIVEQDSGYIMGSLDVDSLFTIIPLEETIDIYANILFINTEKVEVLSKIEFKELLSLTTKESYF